MITQPEPYARTTVLVRALSGIPEEILSARLNPGASNELLESVTTEQLKKAIEYSQYVIERLHTTIDIYRGFAENTHFGYSPMLHDEAYKALALELSFMHRMDMSLQSKYCAAHKEPFSRPHSALDAAHELKAAPLPPEPTLDDIVEEIQGRADTSASKVKVDIKKGK